MNPTILKTIPLLRIFDVEKAKDFYVNFLGFKVDWDHGAKEGLPMFMQVSLGPCILYLSEHHGDGCPGCSVIINVTGLDAYHKEITSKGYKYMRPGIELMPWNSRIMDVLDPFGNKLCFSEEVAASNTSQ